MPIMSLLHELSTKTIMLFFAVILGLISCSFAAPLIHPFDVHNGKSSPTDQADIRMLACRDAMVSFNWRGPGIPDACEKYLSYTSPDWGKLFKRQLKVVVQQPGHVTYKVVTHKLSLSAIDFATAMTRLQGFHSAYARAGNNEDRHAVENKYHPTVEQ